MKTAIIGAGKMGIWFAKFLKEKGEEVVLADRNKDKLAKLGKELEVETSNIIDSVKNTDRVLICVSISSFEEIVKKIAPSLHEGQVIMDICSIKEAPVKVMHDNIKGPLVLGTHPVFGPGSNGIKHKAFILTPTNPAEEKFAEEFKKWLEDQEAHVFVMSPKKHDSLMSVVLGLPHFLGLVTCETLLEQKDFFETKSVAGTTYRMLLTLAEATAMETPDVYVSLQTSLSDLANIENQFIAKAEELLKLIKSKTQQAITKHLAQVKEKLSKTDRSFGKSYVDMYRMLESTED